MTDLALGPLRFGIVGAGRLGTCIARRLQAAGIEVVHVSSRSDAGRERATHELGVPAYDDHRLVAERVDCVVVCVPDDAVVDVVADLTARAEEHASRPLRIISTSAAHGVEVLAPLASAGHAVCVVHPVASVTTTDPTVADPFRGAGAAIGSTSDAERTFAHAFARALGLVPVDLPGSAQAWHLHAAACTAAANLVSTVLALAQDAAAEIGVPDAVARTLYGRLASQAADRATRDGASEAIGGAITRGDAVSLGQQLLAVRERLSRYEELFDVGVTTAAHAAFVAGRIDMATTRRISAAAGAVMAARIDPDEPPTGS